METIIEFQKVKKSYGDKAVLKGLDLSIEKGSFVTIIGSSGCGKTTALKMVNGFGKYQDQGGGYPPERPDAAAEKYRVRHPGQRPLSPHDRGAEYLLRAQSPQQKG